MRIFLFSSFFHTQRVILVWSEYHHHHHHHHHLYPFSSELIARAGQHVSLDAWHLAFLYAFMLETLIASSILYEK